MYERQIHQVPLKHIRSYAASVQFSFYLFPGNDPGTSVTVEDMWLITFGDGNECRYCSWRWWPSELSCCSRADLRLSIRRTSSTWCTQCIHLIFESFLPLQYHIYYTYNINKSRSNYMPSLSVLMLMAGQQQGRHPVSAPKFQKFNFGRASLKWRKT